MLDEFRKSGGRKTYTSALLVTSAAVEVSNWMRMAASQRFVLGTHLDARFLTMIAVDENQRLL